MHLSKLVKVLQCFDRPQFTRLKKYIHSPYFGVYPQSVALFDYLARLHPGFTARKINVESIGRRIENLSTLHHQVTAGVRLLRTVEKFIAEEQWQKDEAGFTRCLLKGFRELPLPDAFESRYEKEIAQLAKSPEQNFDTFFERHALTELSFNGFDAKLNRTSKNDIMPVVKTLHEFYALKKLRYLCEALNRNQVFGVNYGDEHIPSLLKILEPYTKPQFHYVYLYVNVYRMMAADNYEDSDLYYQLIKQFISQKGATPDRRDAITYAINRCLHWNNKGYENAGNEYLWWIEWKMKHNVLLEKGKLMPITFRNVVNIAVNNKIKPAEIEKLINTYAPHLPEEHHDTSLAFANGLYQYSRKNYKEAIRFFLTAQAKEEVIFNSIIRRWQWMCLYDFDRNDIDALINQLSSFEKYLHRNKQELRHVAPLFQIFIAYAFKLLHSATAEILNSNLSHLQNEEYFPAKPWLMQQFAIKNKKTVPHKTGRVEYLK